MGLDMYIERNKEEKGYWRKANQIHGYFDSKLGPLENCERYDVPKDVLEELLDKCNQIVDKFKVINDEDSIDVIKEKEKYNKELCSEILPVTQGFFFGSYEYDNWYLSDIKDTIEIINDIFKDTNFDEDTVEYYAWW